MDASSEAAEQIVRIALQGTEVTLRLTGAGAKNAAAMLMAACASAEKTRGKATLAAMLKSGKELRVLPIKTEDLKTFAEEAKRYGIVYSVVKHKGEAAAVDLLVRAEDAAKVNRIAERCGFARVTQDEVVVAPTESQKTQEDKGKAQDAETLIDELTSLAKKERAQGPLAQTRMADARLRTTSEGEKPPGKSTEGRKSLRALMRSIEAERSQASTVTPHVNLRIRKTPAKGR